MLTIVKSPDELTMLLRERGMKVTPQRQCIFKALHGSSEHPTADEIYSTVSAQMPTVSRRTVYQTLHDLADMGEIVELDLGTGAARFDPTVVSHHHLVCDRCGAVRDVYADFTGVRVPSGEDHGYRVSSTEIVFRGLCPDCGAAGSSTGRHDRHALR